MPSKTLYLIDGHAQIFRAYYAIRGGMTSPVTGEPTQAVFGFAGMMLKLFNQFSPEYVAMAIDTAGPTFRDELYDQYKANRSEAPDDFAPQAERIFQMVRMFGIPVLGKEGAEADDIIATLCTRLCEDPAVAVKIVSKDKDLQQLLGDRVTMFDIHTDTTLDADWLKAEKGITPSQVVDMLALMGDTIDNVPGVPGIGPKTAAQLVCEFGSLDNLLVNLDKVKGKRRERLEEAAEKLPLSRQLVALKHDVEIAFSMEQARIGAIDAEGLRRMFKELGFRRYLDDLEKLLSRGDRGGADHAAVSSSSDGDGFQMGLFDGGAGAQVVEDGAAAVATESLTSFEGCDYRCVKTRAELDELVENLKQQKRFAVDTETIGLGHRESLCGLCFAWQTEAGVYVPICSPTPGEHLDQDTVLGALRGVLEDASIAKVGHNLKYDLLVLRHHGIELAGACFDTMIAAWLVGTPGQGMDDLALSLLRHETVPISRLIGPGGRGKVQKRMDQVPLDEIACYAAEDADVTLRLYEYLKPRLEEMGLTGAADTVEMPLVRVLADMEWRGIRVDPAVLDEQKKQLAERAANLRYEICTLANQDFNVDSPKQLGEVLFKQLGFPVKKRTKTGPSTDSEVLEKLVDLEDSIDGEHAPLPRLILEYRQLTKLLGTYLEALGGAIEPSTGRVHASFHQNGAATGRLSSSNPNLQNIPIRTEVGRQIRKAFVAEPGHLFVTADYSQIELRVLAHFSEDPALIEAFRTGLDIHTAVACEVFGVEPDDVDTAMRTSAKTINFGIVYGVTPYGLARRIESLDVEAAKKLIASYKERFVGIDRFLAGCVEHALEHGYVQTILGRRRDIPELQSTHGGKRQLGERMAINSVVQGSAADLIKLAMVNLHRRIEREKLPMALLLQIHDELVVETPEPEAEAMAAIVREEMEGAMDLRVPLKVEAGVGSDWYSAK